MDFRLGGSRLMTECSCPSITLQGTSTTLYFPKPEYMNPNNEVSKNVDLFNMWSGYISTVDRGINTQSLNMGGTVCICGLWEGVCFPLCFPICFSSAMTTWLDSVETAMNSGEEFTINELGDCLNGVYVIKDLVLIHKKNTSCFKWRLSLERIRDI